MTAEDYANALQEHLGVQKAYAVFRWTGGWYTVYVSIDRLGGLALDYAFKNDIVEFLNSRRLA